MLRCTQPQCFQMCACRVRPEEPRGEEGQQRWLFVARCQHRSAFEVTQYTDHTNAMEEAGEDFFGNFR